MTGESPLPINGAKASESPAEEKFSPANEALEVLRGKRLRSMIAFVITEDGKVMDWLGIAEGTEDFDKLFTRAQQKFFKILGGGK